MLTLPAMRRTALIAVTAVLAVTLAFILYFVLRSPVQDSSIPLNTGIVEARPGLPARLKIPKINVDAALEHVGLTPEQDMDIPKSPANAAWYKFGPRPGEKGSSVIDGHFGLKNNVPAVFDNLNKLQTGDTLYVEDKKGVATAFVVRESKTYGPNEIVPAVFISSDGKAHLNLITCQGAWNEKQKSYSTRLVVFTDKIVKGGKGI